MDVVEGKPELCNSTDDYRGNINERNSLVYARIRASLNVITISVAQKEGLPINEDARAHASAHRQGGRNSTSFQNKIQIFFQVTPLHIALLCVLKLKFDVVIETRYLYERQAFIVFETLTT